MVGLGAFYATHWRSNKEFLHNQMLISGIQQNASLLAEPQIQNWLWMTKGMIKFL